MTKVLSYFSVVTFPAYLPPMLKKKKKKKTSKGQPFQKVLSSLGSLSDPRLAVLASKKSKDQKPNEAFGRRKVERFASYV
jgi:hypothetical protein